MTDLQLQTFNEILHDDVGMYYDDNTYKMHIKFDRYVFYYYYCDYHDSHYLIVADLVEKYLVVNSVIIKDEQSFEITKLDNFSLYVNADNPKNIMEIEESINYGPCFITCTTKDRKMYFSLYGTVMVIDHTIEWGSDVNLLYMNDGVTVVSIDENSLNDDEDAFDGATESSYMIDILGSSHEMDYKRGEKIEKGFRFNDYVYLMLFGV